MRLFCAFAASFLIAASAAGAATLEEISSYFNAITTLEARFTQVNADGSTSTGTLYMRRPGKLRMEYDANGDGALLIVGAGSVAIFDKKTSETAAQYPLSKTPLAPILARTVDLSRSGVVEGLTDLEEGVSLQARDPDHPEYGAAEFDFEVEPLRLASWSMTNEYGETTRVFLDPEMKSGHALSLLLFSIPQEQLRRGR